MLRRCPYARRVAVFSIKFRNSFITRWYCTRAEVWCPYRARRRECPYLPSSAAFYGFGLSPEAYK
ncbi:MAG: hypothetical protein QXY49_02230 [Thermofilaceae archaeon]